MKIIILQKFKDDMASEETRQAWCDLIELRQRTFTDQFAQALILDKFDLVADHILLYSETNHAMAYVRSITVQGCAEIGQEAPIVSLCQSLSSLYIESLTKFIAEAKSKNKQVVHMSYLCLDHQFKAELKGIKILDFLTWIAFQVQKQKRTELAFCGTQNLKFNLTPWLLEIGKPFTILPPFIHPTVPEPHELVLIMELGPEYWETRTFKYRQFWENAVMLSVPATKIKKSA